MTDKELFGVLSLIVGVVQYAPTVTYILVRRIRPHVFSNFIWGVGGFVMWAAKYVSNAGPGAWSSALAAFCCLLIAGLSYRSGEKSITRNDWVALAGALGGIVLWIFTKDPLGAVLLMCVVDILAYYPTFRKSWHRPREEMYWGYAVGTVRHVCSLWALTNFALVTVAESFVIITANSALMLMLLWRRRQTHQ